MRTERALQAYFIKECNNRGFMATKLKSASARGWPDVLVVVPHEVLLIEFKSPTGKGRLSRHQKCLHSRIGCLGVQVWIIDSKAGADEFIYAL